MKQPEPLKYIKVTSAHFALNTNKVYLVSNSVFQLIERSGCEYEVIDNYDKELEPIGETHVNKKYEELLTKQSTTLTTASTANYKTRSWGFVDTTENTYAEQINLDTYIFNFQGFIGLVSVAQDDLNTLLNKPPAKKQEMRKYIRIGTVNYLLPKKLEDCRKYYSLPTVEEAKKFINNMYEVEDINKLSKLFDFYVSSIYDFKDVQDLQLWKLFVFQSYLKPHLESFFYCGADATKGGSKSTLLEIMSILARHGYMAGDISAASLPRMVENLDLSIFADEVDQHIQGSEAILSILRKGQRKGVPYVRFNTKTMEYDSFDVAGTHAVAFRTQLEDAFIDRTLLTHAGKSKDNRLAVVNLFKKQHLHLLTRKLFFWSVARFFQIRKSQLQLTTRLLVENLNPVASVEGVVSKEHRSNLYDIITAGLSKKEKDCLESFNGRNAELAFNMIHLCRLLGLDLVDFIDYRMQKKQEDDSMNSSIALETLEELLKTYYDDFQDVAQQEQRGRWITTVENSTPNCFYISKGEVLGRLNEKLKNLGVVGVNPSTFTGLLKDFGFHEGTNIKSQRPPKGIEGTPRVCLVYTKDIIERLSN